MDPTVTSIPEDHALRESQLHVPVTPQELWVWVATHLGIQIPFRRVCEDHSTPFNAFCDAYYARESIQMWIASRAMGGKSFLLSALALTEQITLGAHVAILGGSGEQSRRVHEYLTGVSPNARNMFWNCPLSPRWMIEGDLETMRSRTKNGGELKALMASSKSVRGLHPNRLRGDEIDEMEFDILEAALGQTISDGRVPTNTVLSSTHHYPDGPVTKMLRRARERGWKIHEWCLEESRQSNGGWLLESEIERKRNEVSDQMWRTEFLLQEPNPQDRAFNPDQIETMFHALPGIFAGDADPLRPVRLEEPDPNGFYCVGFDMAKSHDWSVITVYRQDVGEPYPLVCWQRLGRLPWSVIIGVYCQRLREYPGRAFHDATGVGAAFEDWLTEPSEGIVFSKADLRFEVFSRYATAVDQGRLAWPMIVYAYDEHKTASTQQVYGKEHTPDSVVSGALAWKALSEGTQEILMSWR